MDHSNLAGKRLGKYEIREKIGRGGMGAVYKGYDPTLDRHVAIKVLAPHLVWQEEFVERFLREARAAARLKHPSIVTIYDVGQEANWYYFVMEFLEGETLTEFIVQRYHASPDDVIEILRPLAEALDYAHQRGVVHRDIKPGNIIVGPEGLVTLTDFGIARAAQETRLTTTGTIVGTPEYMSPEQVRGLTVDARSDHYSLAVVAYEMLSGQVPFDAESTLALLHKVAYEPPPPICQVQPDLPAGVEAVLHKALAKEADDRFTTAAAFVDALGRALAGEEVVKTPTLVADIDLDARSTPAVSVEPPPEPAPLAIQPIQPKPQAAPSPARQPQAASATRRLSDAHPEPTPPQPEPPPAKTAALDGEPSPELPSPAVSTVERWREALKALPGWVWAVAGLALVALVIGIGVAGSGQRNGKAPPTTVAGAAEETHPVRPPSASAGGGPLSSRILLVSDRSGKREIYHLTNEGQVEQITRTPGDGESWSPVSMLDGTVLFTSNRDGKREIYHLTKSGDADRATRTPGDGESWSPDSMPNGTILFTSNRDGKREVYHLTKSAEVERVTSTPGSAESWSPVSMPDGTVLFTSNRDGTREIYHLTKSAEVERVTNTPGGAESWSPASMPNGTILFTSNRDGKREVYHLTKGAEVERVTSTPGSGESWSPVPMLDGTVLFTSNRDGKREIYHLTKGAEVERVTSTPGSAESWSLAR